MITDKRHEVSRLRTEAQLDCQFQQEPDMEVAEVSLYGVQKKDVLLAPFIHALFIDSFLKHTEHHLGHEHRHGVLVDAVPDTHERMSRHQPLDGIERRFR